MANKTDTSTTAGKIVDLNDRMVQSRHPVGEEAIRATHDAGRLTARERIEALLDEGSFVEIDALARHRSTAFKLDKKRPLTDGVVTGHGTVDGRPVCVFSQDASIFDGTIGEMTGEKIVKVLELAIKSGTPIVGFYDGAGARLKEGVVALEVLSQIFRLQAQASGVIPQIAVVAGPTGGAQVHGVAMNDVVIDIADQGTLTLADAEETTQAGADALAGTSHITVPDESAAADMVADALAYLPSNNRALAPMADAVDQVVLDLNTAIPDSSAEAYDMREILEGVLDEDSLLELGLQFAPNLITAFARIAGKSVGVLANQPLNKAGGLDIDSAEKATYFIRLCDAFNIPLISFIDVPGFLPEGADAPVIRRTTKLFHAQAGASVGKITVVTRKATGSAYLALAAKRMGTDLVFAWPTAEIAVADAEDIAADTGVSEDEIRDKLVNPYEAAARGLVDAVIPPAETRDKIIEGLRLLERKVEDSYPRKHDTMAF